MSPTPEQALTALQGAQQMSMRSATLYRYRQASPHFILWGLVWLLAYALTDFLPGKSGVIWLVCDGLGVLGAVTITLRRPSGATVGINWRMAAAVLTMVAFVAAVMAVFPPLSGKRISTLITLVVAACYVLTGIWNGPRIAVVGVAVGVLSLFGYFVVDSHFNLWMAAVGGGALIAAGLWMRKI